MRIRAFATTPAATVALLAVLLTTLLVGPTGAAAASPTNAGRTTAIPLVSSVDDDDTTRPTVNEFFPEERPLSDCLSSLPKPDCGSEARGGWAQTTVFLAIVIGLAFIAWRVVAASRRARRAREVTPGTPDATTARDGDGGVPAP